MKKILILFFMLCAISQLRCSPDINWGSEVSLSSAGVNSSDPQIVMDSNANAIAAWVENGVIKASYFSQMGMSWGAAQTLSGSGSSSPKLGVDGSGNVTAIWLDSTGVVNASTLPFGGSWSAATAVSASGSVTPRLAVDSAGNAIAAWSRSGFIETSTKLFGGSWNTVSMISGASSNNPDLAISAFGNAIIVWHTVVAGQDQILSSTATIGGTWGAAKTIIAGTFKNNYPKVALDPSGNAITIWFRWVQITDAENVFVAASILSQGGIVWTPAVFLSNAGLGNPANFTARVSSDPFGNVFVIWSISYDGSTYNIETAVHQNGQAFTTLNTIASSLYSFEADAAINSLSDAVIAMMFWDGSNNLIQSMEALIYGAQVNIPTPPVNLSTNPNNGFPRIASVISAGVINAATVWITFDGMNNIIAASTGSRTGIDPPHNLMVVQSSNNFGVFTEFFNTLTWDPSTDPNLNAYGIFRNGVFIREVGSQFTSFVDDNQVQNGSITYGVSAVTGDGSQSSVSSVSFP